jgi:beta-barrel assembly-enhancing protease
MLTSFLRRSGQLRRRWFYGLISIVVALGLVIGSPYSAQALPWLNLLIQGVQLVQLSSLSDNQEISLGKQIDQQLKSQEFRVYSDRAVTDYVTQVGQRLVPHSDRPNIPYTFQVVDDRAVNAFATMGGYVYVTTGLLKTADNEAQLASVMGHEIGHIAARHALQQLRQNAVARGLMTAAGVDQNALVNLGVELAVSRPNSRQHEYEADQRGLNTIERTGYAPGAMVAFLKKLLNLPSPPSFLSTHPATSDRIRALEQMINPATANVGAGLDTTAYRSRMRDLG